MKTLNYLVTIKTGSNTVDQSVYQKVRDVIFDLKYRSTTVIPAPGTNSPCPLFKDSKQCSLDKSFGFCCDQPCSVSVRRTVT
jgi:hypothetical protein